MPLADDIRAARDQALAELTAAHDYYADTITTWRLVAKAILGGQTFAETNSATGTVTTEVELATKIPRYAAVQLAAATFQSFLAIFEAFFTDLLRAWLRAQPQYLMPTEPVDFPTIYNAPDRAAVIDSVIDRKVQGLFYRRPADWFKFIEEKLHLGCPTADEVARVAEAKATRDVLIHNRGVVNEVYVAKAGALARFVVGEQVDIPDPYHREVWDLLRKVVADLSDAMLGELP